MLCFELMVWFELFVLNGYLYVVLVVVFVDMICGYGICVLLFDEVIGFIIIEFKSNYLGILC